MKNSAITILSLSISLLVLFSACKKDDEELMIDVNARLLAGNPGQSKSWLLKNYFRKIDNQNEEEILTSPADACTKDNIYTFKNNTAQDYVCDEGASKCSPTNGQNVEGGYWYFTNDGKYIVVQASYGSFFEQNESLALFDLMDYRVRSLGTIVKLTDTEFEVHYRGQSGFGQNGPIFTTHRLIFNKQ
jgi:hypothetical protein